VNADAFEEFIFPSYPMEDGYSALSHLTWILYNCDNRVAKDTSYVLFGRNIAVGDVPVDGSGIPGFDRLNPATYDPFQVRGDLKYLPCPDWVASLGNDFRSWSFIDNLIQLNEAFETDAPPGASLNNPFDFFTIVNMPQDLVVDLRQDNNLPDKTPMGNLIEFWGMDDAKTWFYTVNGGPTLPVYSCLSEDCYVNVQDSTSFANLSAHITVPVQVGDRVTISTYSSYTPHGLLFWLSNRLDDQLDMEASDLYRFFEVDSTWNPAVETHDPKFAPTDTDYFYGDPTAVIGYQLLFSGVVKPSAIGADEYGAPAPFDIVLGKSNHMELFFTDSVYGPAAMTVRLHAISTATHFYTTSK